MAFVLPYMGRVVWGTANNAQVDVSSSTLEITTPTKTAKRRGEGGYTDFQLPSRRR